MKKYLLVCAALFCTGVSAATTPLERLLLANDYEVWLSKGKSYLNWKDFGGQDIKILSGVKQPVQVYMDFKSNPIAAEEKYKGVQKVFGHISAIEKDHNGELRLLFNVGSFDRLYAYGLSKNEIMRLRVPDRVDLHCMGFEMNSVGDINGICSMIDDPYKFIAISTVQYREAVNKLTPPKQFKTEWDLLKPFYNKEVEQNINENCAYIDSTNMEGCYSLINDLVDSSKLAEIKHKRQLNK